MRALISRGDAFLAVLVAHSACCFAGITIVVMTAAFIVLTDMEQPFSGFVQIDTSMFLLIRRDIRVVLRSAHLEQLAAIEKESKESSSKQLTDSQLQVRDFVGFGPSYMSLRSYTATHQA